VPTNAAAAEAAAAAKAPRTRGPEVFMGLDQRELDDAYDQQVWAPNSKQVNGRLAVLSV
jgi:arylformamidase